MVSALLDEVAAAIARAMGDNLLTAPPTSRSGTPPPVLMVRETPFNLAHLRNMTAATEMGAVIFPPLPASTTAPEPRRSIDAPSSVAARAAWASTARRPNLGRLGAKG